MNSRPIGLVHKYGGVRAALSSKPGVQISLLSNQKALQYSIPKSGTRSLNQYLDEDVEGYYHSSQDVVLSPFFRDWFKCAIIRNPLERMRSVWRQKILGGLGTEVFGLTEPENEKLRDFDEFLRWLGEQNLDSREVHIRKQTTLIPVEEMDFIGTSETLEENVATTCSRLNLEHLKLSHINETKRLDSPLAAYTHNLILSDYQEDSVLRERLKKKRHVNLFNGQGAY